MGWAGARAREREKTRNREATAAGRSEGGAGLSLAISRPFCPPSASMIGIRVTHERVLQMLHYPRNIRPVLSNHPWEAFMRRISLVTLLIAFITAPAFAQPLADKVPANPIFYFGWNGSDNLGSSYGDSHLKA